MRKLKYMELKYRDMWRISIIKEALDTKFGNINPPDSWPMDELVEKIND